MAGALQAYERTLTPKKLELIKKGQLIKSLTIVTDGEVANQEICIAVIARLRKAGITVNGLGFGQQAEQIKLVCNDPSNPEAATVLTDVTQAVATRYGYLKKALKRL